MRKIALMPEYECDGIWNYILYKSDNKDEPDVYGICDALDLDDFPISTKTKNAVRRWNKVFDFNNYYIEWSGRKEKQFDKRGKKAAQMLANDLNGKIRVFYTLFSIKDNNVFFEIRPTTKDLNND
jgi:hypothetical protein